MATERVNARYQRLTTPPVLIQGDPIEGLFTPTVDQRHLVGSMMKDAFGRSWRYIRNAAVELAVGYTVQSEAPDAQCLDNIQTGYTTAAGDTVIQILVATGNALSDGELKDGWLVVNKATGIGYTYPIKWNRWITSDTVMEIELYEPIRLATSATSEFTLVKNKYADVVVTPTTPTGTIVGVPNVVIPASYYGWVQSQGPCGCYVDTSETLVIGCAVGHPASSAVPGAVGVFAATGPYIGHSMTVSIEGEVALVDLDLDKY